MNEFKQNPDSWMHVDSIIEHSKNVHTNFFALSILEDAINVYLTCVF
jgi:hypothetical protein